MKQFKQWLAKHASKWLHQELRSYFPLSEIKETTIVRVPIPEKKVVLCGHKIEVLEVEGYLGAHDESELKQQLFDYTKKHMEKFIEPPHPERIQQRIMFRLHIIKPED